MILPMSRIRLMGPRELLTPTVGMLQDFGRLQVDVASRDEGLAPMQLAPREQRERRQIERLLADAEGASAALGLLTGRSEPAPPATRQEFAKWARQARRARREVDRIAVERGELEEERALALRYRDFLEVFRAPLTDLAGSAHLTVYGVTVPAGERKRVEAIAEQMQGQTGARTVLLARPLPSGDIAVLIAVPKEQRGPIEQALAKARIPEVPLPAAYAGRSLTEAAPAMLARLDEIPREVAALDARRDALARRDGAMLRRACAAAHDRLTALAALAHSSLTAHAFAIEGWLPSRDTTALRETVQRRMNGRVVLEEVGREEWVGETRAPVVLHNPPLFAPFEKIVGLMPLPAYGSIDPTPFVAVSFPMLFGLMLGDVGYGAVLAGLAMLLRARAKGAMGKTVAAIAMPCAVFSVIFGVLYGEIFGTLGTKLLGLHPVLLDREHAIVAAMFVAVGVGLAHIVLGLALGITSARSEPRLAASRVVQLAMVLLVVLALLAAVRVLPGRLFTPFAIAVLVGFPALLILEGIIAPIEFFSTLGNILSYIRIMAIGTASVMLAVVANDMAGMLGSAVVGALFALLFHLVNFGLGLFSPTLHALRLHYVEFFRQFYSPGGVRYEPLSHWHPGQHGAT